MTLLPWNDVDDIPHSQPPPSDHWDAVNDLPPPAKRRRFDIATEPPLKGPHRWRKAKVKANVAANGHDIRPSTVAKHLRPAVPIRTSLASHILRTAHGAYVASLEDAKELYGSKKRWTLEPLVERGFLVIPWDGKMPRPLVDSTGRVFGALAGQPDDPSYAASAQRAFDAVLREGHAAKFPASEKKHRRGLFAAINVGVSYGQGQTKPSWLKSDYEATAESYLSALAPHLYEYYLSHNKLLDARFKLRRPFSASVFSAAAFNFGKNVWTFRHRDVLNLPFGWCAIQALGRFDPTKGGHLILWDLKLVIELPAGALILIPSAMLAHSNIPVQNDETRTSFTQFTAGFRYVDNDFRTEEELQAQDPIAYEAMLAEKEQRWEMGLGLWSTIDELVDARR
uniref:2OGFeDO JBP1/TET oxygenase domain-containing protein n=1 Tax=Mycena chlorophos TaxID=658473 RepID=A0ABQ0LYG4_MYCCL|nr:predicted protein [Mycena chlorophos]